MLFDRSREDAVPGSVRWRTCQLPIVVLYFVASDFIRYFWRWPAILRSGHCGGSVTQMWEYRTRWSTKKRAYRHGVCRPFGRREDATNEEVFAGGEGGAGIRRYDEFVERLPNGYDCAHPEVTYREEECGVPFVCRWSAGIPECHREIRRSSTRWAHSRMSLIAASIVSREKIDAELAMGAAVCSAQGFLRLGIASVIAGGDDAARDGASRSCSLYTCWR